MIVNVHLTNGSVLQFSSRKQLRRALDRDDPSTEQMVTAWLWRHPQTFDVPWRTSEWVEVHATSLRKASVAVVISAEEEARGESDLPAKAHADELVARWRENHPEEAAAQDAGVAAA